MTQSAAEPAVIVLSSLVAGSRVGGGVAASVLARAGIVPEHVPTVTFGRHPGLGAPGGAAVADEAFAGALDGLIANGRHRAARAVLTGYFASPAQVRAAADLIDRARAETPDILVLVDPILGDGAPDGGGAGLYLRPETAAAVAEHLIARADVITPNAFEAAFLTRRAITDASDAAAAAAALGRSAIITSVPAGEDRLAVVACQAGAVRVGETERHEGVPHGTGDLFAAHVLTAMLDGAGLDAAAGIAAGAVRAAIEAALAAGLDDLPVFGPAGRTLFMRAPGTKPPAWVMGLDGCPAGWAGVMIDLNGTEPPRLRIFDSFQAALDAPERAHVIAVDMPIGFEDAASGSGRACEREVRKYIGPRRSSVFASPLRGALYAEDYPAANIANRAGGGKGLSKQCWMIAPKMREIDAAMTPSLEGCVHEVHPEASFTALSGAPMAWPKRTAEGRAERLAVLRRAGFDVSLIDPHGFPKSQAAPDDLVDAAVCALSAARIAGGAAVCFPQNPPRDGRGLRMAIFA